MQEGAPYKDTVDFLSKIKNLCVTEHVLLVTANVVGIYPNIPHEAGLKSLRKLWIKRE